MEVVTQWLGRIGIAVSSKIQKVVGQASRLQSRTLLRHKLASDYAQPNVFEPLTPIVMTDEQSGRYVSELRHALLNDQVRNIAITGDYGAGKSSLIRTFVEKHQELNYAWVSLATFGKDGVVDAPSSPQPQATTPAPASGSLPAAALSLQGDEGGKSSVSAGQPKTTNDVSLVDRIEETIVQQLLYTVKAEDLPKTRLKRIVQASKSSIVWSTVFLSAVVLGGARLYAENLTTIWSFEPGWLVNILLRVPVWVAAIAVTVGVVSLIYRATSLFSAFNIDGLTVKGGKLEATNHGSVLHKNIDEIIYCFERSHIDVVLIEDLDRFGIQDVFFRLREINLIIKNSPQIRRPIFFVYALRDELFVSSEKTKFFDVIIPVIPVVNFENSQQKLIELLSDRKLKNETLYDGLHPVLVETVSYYIDDMRLLKNIVNEFDMYASLLASEINLDRNKLLAIIFIRNLYPKAYAALLRRAGTVYELFALFESWKTVRITEIDAEILSVRSESQARKELVARSVQELRQNFWFELLRLSGLHHASHFQTDGGVYTMMQFLDNEIFESVSTSGGNIVLGNWDYRFLSSGKRISLSEALNSGSPSYLKKVSLLSTTAGSLAATITKLSQEKENLRRLPLKNALKHSSFNEVVVSHFASVPAMSYLVRAGFFSTDYTAYIGYFYAGALGMEDMNLILDLRAGKSPTVDSPLVNPELVLSKLSHVELEDGRGLLAGLVGYLCSPTKIGDVGKKHSEMESILEGSIDHLERVAAVIHALLDTESFPGLVRAIYHHQGTLYQALLTKSEQFSGSQNRQKLLQGMLSSLNEDEIEDIESDPDASFLPLLESLEDVTLLMPGLRSKTEGWKYISQHPVEFHSLGADHSPESLKALIDFGYIKLNIQMLSLIQMTLDPEFEPGSTITYQSLRELSITGLDRLISRNPSSFIRELLTQKGMLPETSLSLTLLLQGVSKDEDLMFSLLERTETIFESLDALPEVLWANILDSDSVLPSKKSVFTFFSWAWYTENSEYRAIDPTHDDATHVEATTAFLSFLERHRDELKGVLWDETSDHANDLQKTLLSDTRFDDASLRVILSETVIKNTSVLSAAIPPGRWELLVTLDYLPYHSKILACITEKAPSSLATYLTQRWDQAAKDFDPAAADLNVLIGVTKSDRVSIRDKVDLWSAVSEEVVKEHAGARAEIARICEIGNQHNVTFPSSICTGMLWYISSDNTIPSKRRIEAFLQIVATKGVEWSHTAGILKSLDEEGFNRLAEKDRKFTVLNSDVNRRFIKALGAKGFVGKVSEKKDKIVVNVLTSALK
ncbi:YobI family P-loop NTPase [Pseudomonas sp. 44 R 15]|uniref:YobI family P-loop NTPase n=1 Tax=Pseudomonas sp. 44 R 15 TaxID=1844105 RepID=UPI0008126958|nr:hypothetical protein [Pseudomonas sp. 44 R 15]CRM33054.1 hypothetical protein [Pseudomonas sp. 44 R 15]